MKAILVFIDGTTCDMRHRIDLQGTTDFFAEENIRKDIPTAGSVECMNELAKTFILQEWSPNWDTVRKYL